jgi:topoisomerase-4 subunit B
VIRPVGLDTTSKRRTQESLYMSKVHDLFNQLETELQPAAKPAPKPAAKPASGAVKKPAAKPVAVDEGYSAADIEVLEGLEPVRRRPGMYIGGTDEKALHHLFAEVIDNSMDEAVADHASFIEVEYDEHGYLCITDNGRGIPVDPHPKFKDKSALEVIMTTLHAGGKFDSKVYETSGGLHGVGVSVVNALSVDLVVEVARNQNLYRQCFSRGIAQGPLEDMGKVHNRRGTTVRFLPDPEIFGKKARFKPKTLFKMARSKAYLFGGVQIRWNCHPNQLGDKDETPQKAVLHFPGGLKDYLEERIEGKPRVTDQVFAGNVKKEGGHGSVEWAICWFGGGDGFIDSYCNTVPTIEGGTHEQGLRLSLTRSLKAYAELSGNKKGSMITPDDVMASAGILLSVFVREPEFQGQTKEKLATQEASKIVDVAIRDHFDHWLTGAPAQADKLLDWVVDRAEDRLRRRQEREVGRKTAVRKLRLPGKLADCASKTKDSTEIFIVEGDSAGGSAKQARNRNNQAILPLRGKILNVASATRDKIHANQQLSDLTQALGCGIGERYRSDDLRYDRVIIMTDADVDGAHIASLLITFFYRLMPQLIKEGHLYIAVPPLYRLSQGAKTAYARDDEHKDQLIKDLFNSRGKIEISRFKGLGEMLPKQLKETTMDPKNRTVLRVEIANEDAEGTKNAVTQLMGTKPEARFNFITERAEFVGDEELDI